MIHNGAEDMNCFFKWPMELTHDLRILKYTFSRAARDPFLIEKLLNSRSIGQFARKINLLNNINIIDNPLQNERVFKLQ